MIDGIRAATAIYFAWYHTSKLSPYNSILLAPFLLATIKEISHIFNKSQRKHRELVPLPTWLLKKAASVLTSVRASCSCRLVSSETQDRSSFSEEAHSSDDLSSYWSISNLRLFSNRRCKLIHHVQCTAVDIRELHPDQQSAYHRFQLTETVAAVMHNDIVNASGANSFLSWYHWTINSFFDTVDHQSAIGAAVKIRPLLVPSCAIWDHTTFASPSICTFAILLRQLLFGRSSEMDGFSVAACRLQNAATQPALNLEPRYHVTSALRHLHWLSVHYRVQFKLLTTLHSFYIQHYSALPKQPDSRNRGALKPAPNTGCHEIAECSASVRSSSLDCAHVTNFRAHSASLPTESSSENFWQVSYLAICLLFD